MVRSLGAQLGLFAFAMGVLAGLYAGNSPVTILLRALLVMAAGCALGQFVGWVGKQVLRDHLQKKKLAVDREHFAAVGKMNADAAAEQSPTAPASGG